MLLVVAITMLLCIPLPLTVRVSCLRVLPCAVDMIPLADVLVLPAALVAPPPGRSGCACPL